MDRRQWLGQCLALVTGAIGGCGRRRTSGVVRVATVPGMYSAPVHLAAERGYFSDAGLEAAIEPCGDDSQAVVLLASGQVDAALMALTPAFVNALAKQSRMRIVASRQIASASCGSVGTLYGNRSVFPRGMGDLGELKGKRIAVTGITAFTAFCLDAFLEKAGLETDSVRVTPMRPQESIAALVAGKLDAAVVSQLEYDLEARSPKVVKGISLGSIYPDFQVSFAMFGARLLDREPRTGARFLAAYLRGASAFMAGETPGFLDNYARQSHLDPEKIRKGCHGWFAKGGAIDAGSVNRWMDWMTRRQFCVRRLTFEELTDTRFLDGTNA
jgi:NitT/TauT family transport system substrate-binding protein